MKPHLSEFMKEQISLEEREDVQDFHRALKAALGQEDATDEELLVALENGETIRDLQQAVGDLDYLVGLEAGIEELVSIEGAFDTPQSTRLVHHSVQLALVGSGVSAEELCPSLESHDTVSMESIGTSLKKIWNAILNMLKRVWRFFSDFFSGIGGDIQRIKLRLTQVRHKAQNATGKSITNATTNLNREINALCVWHRPPRAGKDIVDGLNEFNRHAKVLYDTYTKAVINLGEKLTTLIKNTTPANAEKTLQEMTELCNKVNFRTIGSAIGSLVDVVDSRWENGVASRPPILMGNKGLFFLTPKPRKGAQTLLASAEAARGQRPIVAMASADPKPALTKGEIDTIPAAQGVTICELVDNLLTTVKEYQPEAKRLEKTHDELRKASETLSSRADRNGIDKKTEDIIRSILNFNPAFSHWACDAVPPFSGLAVTASRAALIAVSKSTSNHG